MQSILIQTSLLYIIVLSCIFQFVLCQDKGERFCSSQTPLFVNETCTGSCLPTLGVVIFQQQTITLTQFVSTINNTQCSSAQFSLFYESTFPMELSCTNGTIIFAHSRAVGEACLFDDHCISSPLKPTRCSNSVCQLEQAVTLEKNSPCSIQQMRHGTVCGTNLACDTYFTNTCQSLCDVNPCESGFYCALTFSDNTFNQPVQVCTPIRKLGETCAHSNIFYFDATDNCEEGTRCSYENDTCIPVTRVGERCFGQGECEKGAECATNFPNPTCVALPDIGAPCDDLLGCKNTTTSFCSSITSLCTAYLTAGSACALDESICQPSLVCSPTDNGAICSETGQVGQACRNPLHACNDGLFCNPFQTTNGTVGYRCESELPKSGAVCDPSVGCASGLICGPPNQAPSNNSSAVPLCFEIRQVNQPCTSAVQCASAFCEEGTCKPAKQVNENCNLETIPCEPPLLCSFGKCIEPFSLSEGANCSGVTYPYLRTDRRTEFEEKQQQVASEPIYHECDTNLSCYKGTCTKFAPCDVTTSVLPLTISCQCRDNSSVRIYNCYWELQNYTNCLNNTGLVERVDLPLPQCNQERISYYQCRFLILQELFPRKTLGDIPNVPTLAFTNQRKSEAFKSTFYGLLVALALLVFA